MRKRYVLEIGTVMGLLGLGLAAGVTNGLLGAGGGTVIIYGIESMLKSREQNGNDVFATALCVMLPISVVSCFIYAARGHIRAEGFGLFVLPAIIGGAVGGLLLGKIRSSAVKKLFAVLVVISGILLIVR
jgi:uncharacterized membrane protein YfcA